MLICSLLFKAYPALIGMVISVAAFTFALTVMTLRFIR